MARSKKKGKGKAPAGLSPVAALGPTLRRLMEQVEAGEVDAEALRDRLDASLRGIAPEKALPILLSTAVKAGPEALARLEEVMSVRLEEAGEAEILAELLASGRLDPDAVDLGRRWLEGSGVDLSAIPDSEALRRPRLVHACIAVIELGYQESILTAWHLPGQRRQMHLLSLLRDFGPEWKGAIQEIAFRANFSARAWSELLAELSGNQDCQLRDVDGAEARAAILRTFEIHRAKGIRLPAALIEIRDLFLQMMDVLGGPDADLPFGAEDFDALANLERRPERLLAHERRYGVKVTTEDGRRFRILSEEFYDPAQDYERDLADDEEIFVTNLHPAALAEQLSGGDLRRVVDGFDDLDSARDGSPEAIQRLLTARRAAWETLRNLKAGMIAGAAKLGDAHFEKALREHGSHLRYVIEYQHPNADADNDYVGERYMGYRAYLARFARYGDQRSLLDFDSYQSVNQASLSHAVPKQIESLTRFLTKVAPWKRKDKRDGKRLMREMSELAEEAAETIDVEAARDLLLADAWLIEDVLPLAPPPEPPDWRSPRPLQHDPSVAALLEIGPDERLAAIDSIARSPVWRKAGARRALLRLATDPGLLGAWPGKPESWAPGHAMSLIARLDAHELVEGLQPVLDDPKAVERYASHLFSTCLARMGPEVEAFTWSAIRNPELPASVRGMALVSLRIRAERMPERAAEIARPIAAFLQEDDPEDPARHTVNAFAAHVVDVEKAFPREIATPAIEAADAAGRIDRSEYNLQELIDYGLRE